MLIVLPPLAVVLAGLLLRSRGHGLPKALLMATVFVAAFAVILTEVQSLLGLLNAGATAVAWGGLVLGLGGWMLYRDGGEGMPRLGSADAGTGEDRGGSLLMAGGVVLWAGVLVLGGLAPPSTPDVLTYHLPRVMHWLQNGTVAHYPTWVARQLYMPPGGEYLLLQAMLLAGPRVLNLVQGGLLAAAALGAGIVTRRLGGGRLAGILGAVFVLTLPMGLLQGMTAQNDLVVSFWLLGLVVFTLEVTGGEGARCEDHLAWGICLGLAGLTKGTAWIYAFPAILVVAYGTLRRSRRARARVVGLVVLPPLLLMAPHLVRMEKTFGHPLGSAPVRNLYSNDTVGPRVLASNVLRNLTLQLNTPVRGLNDALERGVRRLHGWMGISPEDSRTTWLERTYRITRTVPGQDRASNPLHVVLLLFVLAGLAVQGRRAPPSQLLLGGGLLVAFLGFCAVLKWQPWHARLHLPLLVAAAPLVAVRLEGALGRRGLGVLGGLFLLQGGILLAVNLVHPVVWSEGNVLTASRHEQMFLKRSYVREPYRRLTAFLRAEDCDRMGLVWQGHGYEYPLWARLDPLRTGRTLYHVAPPGVSRGGFVAPPSVSGDRTGFRACLWVCRGTRRCEGLRTGATRLERFGPYSVWRPRGREDQAASSAEPSTSPRSSRIRRAAASRSSPDTRRSKSPRSETERR